MIKTNFQSKYQQRSEQTTILLCKGCMSELFVDHGHYKCPNCGPML
jgi:predicted RNA-binding Zn-ribbon protein involved in translation (DUF1610 family)